jgi:ribosomal protein S6 kinase alpha-5
LSAIEALHAAKLMHRDVKLDNFRFADEMSRNLKLLDFGFCKVSSGKPETHTVTGTLLYAAPEVFEGKYCQSCDLWSIGVVLFHLLSGQLPFQTSDVMILRSMHRDPVLMGASLFRGMCWKKVPSEGRMLVRSLLTVDPTKRLSAFAAKQHPWLVHQDAPQERTGSFLSLGNFSQSVENLLSVVELKRSSNTTWNLVEAAGDSLEEEEQSLSASESPMR